MTNKIKFKETEIGKITEDWELKKIGDEIELCYGKGLTRKKRIFGPYPVFGSNGIVDSHNEYLVKGPGIIIGRKGSVGEVKFSKKDFWPIDTTYYVKLKEKGSIIFWYYFLLTLRLDKMNSHSAVPGLNREMVYELTKKIPAYNEQKAIAKILSDLDSKIELNRKMNKTLEAIGQALFKRWFVDFEFPCLPENYKFSGAGKPILPNSARKPDNFESVCTYKSVGGLPAPQPGKHFIYVLLCADKSFYIGIVDDLYDRWYQHKVGEGAKWTKANKPIKVIHWEEFSSRVEAAQREQWLKTGYGRKWLKREFKAGRLRQAGEMVESELGKIPKGWHVGKYCDVVSNIKEALKPGEHLSNRRYVPIDSLPMNRIGLINNRSYADARSSLIAFEKGDILFGAMRAYFHRVNFAPYKGVTRTTTFVLRPNKDYYLSYGLFLLNQESSVDYANQHSKGSTMPYAVWENGLASMPIVIPNDETLRAYHDLISLLLQRIAEASEQNKNLSQIRDSLLPRLMSGRIRVPMGEL